MDLLASSRVYNTILEADQDASMALANYVLNPTFRNPDDRNSLVQGYGGSGGKMIIRIKYRLRQNDEIERTLTATFTSDTGEIISSVTTVIVEKTS